MQNTNYSYSPNDDKNIYLEDFLSNGGAGYNAELGLLHLTIFDMGGNNVSEVVLDLSFFSREWYEFSQKSIESKLSYE